MLLLIGLHKLSNSKRYWETTPNTFVQVMSDWSLVVFFISVTTNNLIKDKFHRLCSVTNELNDKFLKLSFNGKNNNLSKNGRASRVKNLWYRLFYASKVLSHLSHVCMLNCVP